MVGFRINLGLGFYLRFCFMRKVLLAWFFFILRRILEYLLLF